MEKGDFSKNTALRPQNRIFCGKTSPGGKRYLIILANDLVQAIA